MAVEVDVKKSDIPMSPVKKGHTTVWHLQKMKDEGKKSPWWAPPIWTLCSR